MINFGGGVLDPPNGYGCAPVKSRGPWARVQKTPSFMGANLKSEPYGYKICEKGTFKRLYFLLSLSFQF